MMDTSLPPLPEITDQDLVLSVFVYHEDMLGSSETEQFNEAGRLAQLGKRVIDQAITFHYFKKRNPVLSAEQIDSVRDVNTPDYPILLVQYGLKNKIRCPAQDAAYIDTQEGAFYFFCKYMGAAFLLHGMASIQEWVSQVIDPGSEAPLIPVGQPQNRPPARLHSVGQQPPPPPTAPPPQPPPPPSYFSSGQQPFPLPPTQTNHQVLAQFNMTAHQRGYSVTYPARSEGAHHNPTWHVKCCLNGEPRGEGTGKNQKQAKEAAARQAWSSMGWGQVEDS